jgi:hypothetical protein
VVELEDGLCRFEVLLDAVRATTLRAAVDAQAADWIRQAQYDHTTTLPADVASSEQINAHALTRLAEVYLTAPAHMRRKPHHPGRNRLRHPGPGQHNPGPRAASARTRRGRRSDPSRRRGNRHRPTRAPSLPRAAHRTRPPGPALHLRRLHTPPDLRPPRPPHHPPQPGRTDHGAQHDSALPRTPHPHPPTARRP